MKKLISGILMLALLLSLSTTSVLAAPPASRGRCLGVNTTRKCRFADSICQFIDSDDDGVCDNRALNNYIDANEDGICDNYNQASCQTRTGKKHYNGTRRGHCNR